MTTSQEPTTTPTPDTLAEVPRASKRVIFGLIMGNFGIWLAFFSPVIVLFAVKVGQLVPDGKEVALAIALGFCGVAGIIANPIVGRLSDRSRSRFGRRRPWIIGTTLFGIVGEVIAGASTNMTIFTVGAVIGAIAFAGALSVLLAIIPEHIARSQQGSVAGLMGVSQAVATVFGLAIGGALLSHITVAFVVPGVLGLIALLPLWLNIKEGAATTQRRTPLTFRDLWSSFWTSPRKNPDFGWAWLSRFAIYMAFAAVVNYQVYFLNARLHIPTAQTASLVTLATLVETAALVVTSIVAGRISDRVQRRKPFVFVAAAVGAVGLILMAFTTAVPGFLVAMAVIGLAQGTYYSIDLALVAQILPNTKQDAAKDFGVLSIASNLPQTLSPVIAPLFLAIGAGTIAAGHANYTALFLGSAIFAVVAAVAALRIRAVR